jgi:MFS family permease
MMTLVALPWFILETTGSAGRTGLTGMAFALPAFLAGIFGGVLVDRLGGRQMAIFSDLISGLSVALIPLFHQTVGLPFWLFLGYTFASAIFDVPGLTARRVMLPEMADRNGIRHEAMNSWFELMQGIAIIVGPALAGFAIGWVGAINLLWLNAATFVFSSALLFTFNRDVGKPADLPDTHEHAFSSWTHDILTGFRFLRNDSLLLILALLLTVFNFLGSTVTTIVMPVYIEDRYGTAARLGVLLTAIGIGNLVGGLAFGAIGHRLRPYRKWIMLIGLAVWGLMQWLLVPQLAFWFLLVLVFVAGFLEGPVNPLLVTVRMERIPEYLRGRVFGTFTAMAHIATPVGMVFTGYMLEHLGLEEGIIALAVIYTVLVVGLLFVRQLNEMNRPKAEA